MKVLYIVGLDLKGTIDRICQEDRRRVLSGISGVRG